MAKQYTVGNAQSFSEISVYKSPNEVIKARVFSLKATKHSEFSLVGIGSVEVTPVTNIPDECQDAVSHYVKGIPGLLYFGFGK